MTTIALVSLMLFSAECYGLGIWLLVVADWND
jgi:hypothetical protein